MAYFFLTRLTRVRLEKILWTIMFTIIAGSEFMIAVIVRSERSKTLVTLSPLRKQQHGPRYRRCGHRSLMITPGPHGAQTTPSITDQKSQSGHVRRTPGSGDATVPGDVIPRKISFRVSRLTKHC